MDGPRGWASAGAIALIVVSCGARSDPIDRALRHPAHAIAGRTISISVRPGAVDELCGAAGPHGSAGLWVAPVGGGTPSGGSGDATFLGRLDPCGAIPAAMVLVPASLAPGRYRLEVRVGERQALSGARAGIRIADERHDACRGECALGRRHLDGSG